jgi:ankyrin repeat protein
MGCVMCYCCPCKCCKPVNIEPYDREKLNPDHILSALIFSAYANECDAITKLLLLTGGDGIEPAIMADDADKDGRTALMMAAAGGHVEGAPVFLQSDATGLGPEGPGLLPAAYGAENVQAAELLFDRNEQDIATGARVKRRAAEAAIWEEERQKAEKEAEEAAEKAKRSGKKLWGAARGGLAAAGVMSLSAFRLKQEVPMVNIADNKGRTAIMYAAGAGHNKMIEFLLERGAEIDATCAHATRILFGALH